MSTFVHFKRAGRESCSSFDKATADQGSVINLRRADDRKLGEIVQPRRPGDREHRRGSCAGRCLLLNALRLKSDVAACQKSAQDRA
jgi:hypothetical protein